MSINIWGPKEGDSKVTIINTGAKANVMPLSTAKGLGCLILSTKHLKLKTVSGQILQFLGIVKVYVKVEHRVSYKTVFFLIKNSLLVLLGQPFTKAIKLTFEYPKDRSIKAVMISPRPGDKSTCTVIVVSPLKSARRTRKQAFIKGNSDKEEN